MFFLIGLIGIAMFFYGVKIILKKFKCKNPIAEIDFTEKSNEINFEQPGLYSICFIGGSYANNTGDLDVNITKDGEDLEIFEKQMKVNFLYKTKIGTEFYQFEIENTGSYKIQFKNIDDLELKASKLITKRSFQKKLPIENIGIIVRETTSNLMYIMSILLMVFGFNIAGWGFILIFNPDIFG